MSGQTIISADISASVSFAMQQNHVPVVRQITIENVSEKILRNVTVHLATDPEIADEWYAMIDSIMPGSKHVLDKIDLRLAPSKLFDLTERIDGVLTTTVYGDIDEGNDINGSGEDVGEGGDVGGSSHRLCAQKKWDLAFLSYDEWTGRNTFPEFLAAFVTPNHPYIAEIIIKAAKILASWNGSMSFNGYQSKNPNNVKKQMAAIYGALQQENISYCMPPAGFEKFGQKIRLCGTIKEQKLGTCLDLALLYAGCLEAVGLHAIVNMTVGHAFPGCWL